MNHEVEEESAKIEKLTATAAEYLLSATIEKLFQAVRCLSTKYKPHLGTSDAPRFQDISELEMGYGEFQIKDASFE